jgi:uncharacterized protein
MSTFAVTVERIGRVWKHENADLLEMASLEGKAYDFVVGKGDFKAGDVVVYFPVDNLLADWICTSLNLTGKLAGRDKNRVKTVRLRWSAKIAAARSRKTSRPLSYIVWVMSRSRQIWAMLFSPRMPSKTISSLNCAPKVRRFVLMLSGLPPVMILHDWVFQFFHRTTQHCRYRHRMHHRFHSSDYVSS